MRVEFTKNGWWRTQSRQTGLRDRARLGNREKHTAMADNAFFWGVQTASFALFVTSVYNALADPEPNEAEQKLCKLCKLCKKPSQAKAQFAFPRPSWSS